MAQKILREVPEFNAFYFFKDEGKYTGNYAVSLIIFYNMLSKIDKESLLFHFRRGDYQNWIKTIIGDNYLANEIKKIDKTVNEELYLDRKKTE